MGKKVYERCNLCNVPLKPIWKDLCNNPDTWFWRECDVCDTYVCPDCSDQDDDGNCKCIACLTTKHHKHVQIGRT